MNKYDKLHNKRLNAYERKIDAIYSEAVKEAARLGVSVSDIFDKSKPFSFADYPTIKRKVAALINSLNKEITAAIVNGVESEWTLANNKNNELCRQVFGDKVEKLPKAQYRRYFNNNDKAREAFLQRKENGLNLSDRVWKYTDQFKKEIEMGLDLGIRSGYSAPEMVKDLKQYLRHPEMLFRRVRDEYGQLHLSKAAADYHPGRGVYRSSYKNARRLAATETNIAYRTADYERWQQFDFVVGIEVRLSDTNHTSLGGDGKPHAFADICDDLKGRYPKDFKFTGWHPHCRCHAVTILKTEKEMAEDNKRILNGEEPTEGSVNEVDALPKNFTDWVEANSDRIEAAKNRGTLPYFIKDNEKIIDGKKMVTETSAKTQTEIDRLAKAIGVSVGGPMTHEQADLMHPNPHYADDEQYRVNCQSAVVAYELRRRGMDVEAFGNTSLSMADYLSKRTNAAWLTADGGMPTSVTCRVETKRGKSKEAAWKVWNEILSETSDVGRYHIKWTWNGKKNGHIITMETLADGKRRFYDPQTGYEAKSILPWMIDSKFKVRFDIKKGISAYRVDNLQPNSLIVQGVVKGAGSKLATQEVTLEQMRWWAKNVDSRRVKTSSVSSLDFEPYSPEIVKRLKECKGKAEKNKLFQQIFDDDKAFVLSRTEKAVTKYYPEHRAMKGATWENTKQMAIDLNKRGVPVCFLPEYNDKTSADAIAKFGNNWKIADFKYSGSLKSNTIALDMLHAFKQADCCIIKIQEADKGILEDALDYLNRNNKEVGEFIIQNEYGKYKMLTKQDIRKGRYGKILKGFL